MNQDENTAKHILSVLRHQPIIVMSWGLDPQSIRIARADNMAGLQFSVNGFIHQGKVQVLYNEGQDLFEIRLLSDNDIVQKRQDEVYVGELVSTIDSLIEKCPDYRNRITQEYGFLQG